MLGLVPGVRKRVRRYMGRGGEVGMNAYQKYLERRRKEQTRNIVEENVDGYIQHMDMIVLVVLHDEYGFGARRLKKVYESIVKKAEEYKKYIADNDRVYFNDDQGREREDTYNLKKHLKQIGFDYDAVVAEMESSVTCT
jgi:microsomal dipeptidase-like Zn-dependent dipeptidase